MVYLYPFVIASILFINGIEARWKPTQDLTWNIILGSKVNLDDNHPQVMEIDLDKGPTYIDKLHKKGSKVICYFSGGTIEEYRKDYDEYKAVDGLVRNRYTEWPDERWLDYRVSGIKPLIKNRMKLAVEYKCDAIDVDNLDGYQIKDVKKWDDPLTKDDAITFIKWLGETAHSYDLSIGLKNCLNIVDEVGNYYDFAINEGCIHRDECHWYENFLKKGKPVFGITYNGLSKNKEALCRNLNGLPITMIIKDSNELSTQYVTFDGKKHCGSDFNRGTVSRSSSSSDKNKKTSSSSNDKTKSKENHTDPSLNHSVNSDNNINDKKFDYMSDYDENDNQKDHKKSKNHSGIVTGVAITGSIIGSAALFLFFKSNPKHYEHLIDNISRGASSVKRSASSVTNKIRNKTLRTRSNQVISSPMINSPVVTNRSSIITPGFSYPAIISPVLANPIIDFTYDLNDNPFSTYRYTFNSTY